MVFYGSNRKVIQRPTLAAFPPCIYHCTVALPALFRLKHSLPSPVLRDPFSPMTSLVHSCLSSTFYLSLKVGPFNSREFTYLFKNKYSPPKNSLRELYFTWGHDFRILYISRVKTIVKVNHTTYVKLNKLQKLFNQFLRNGLDKCLPFFHDRRNCSKGACFTTLVGNTIRPELKSANHPIRFNLIGAFKKSETFLYHFWKTVSNILAQNCNNLKKIFTNNRE